MVFTAVGGSCGNAQHHSRGNDPPAGVRCVASPLARGGRRVWWSCGSVVAHSIVGGIAVRNIAVEWLTFQQPVIHFSASRDLGTALHVLCRPSTGALVSFGTGKAPVALGWCTSTGGYCGDYALVGVN